MAQSVSKVPLNRYGYNTIARHISMAIIICLPLFLAAQTWSWDWAWVYSIACFLGWTALSVVVAIENPGLLNQRGRRTKDVTANARTWDMILLTVYSILLVVVPVVAGLDYRNGWSSGASTPVRLLGIAMLIFGFVPLTWAMAANKFFDPTVRLQEGHQVADHGPYRYVRHPGYVGVILHFLAVPFVLGTWTALIPALIGVVIYIIRTALEDATLRRELPGYAEYAQRVHYRLLPGIW